MASEAPTQAGGVRVARPMAVGVVPDGDGPRSLFWRCIARRPPLPLFWGGGYTESH